MNHAAKNENARSSGEGTCCRGAADQDPCRRDRSAKDPRGGRHSDKKLLQLFSIAVLFCTPFHLLGGPRPVGAIQCLQCFYNTDPENCMKPGSGKLVPCAEKVKVCQIGTGLRAQNGNKKSLVLVMGRNCGSEEATAVSKNSALIGKLPKSAKMVCEMLDRTNDFGMLSIDRRCVCNLDKCNDQMWDEVMVNPLLESNWGPDAVAVVPTLGSNSVDKLEAMTEGGMDMTVLIAAILGGVLVIGLILLAIWWFVLRKKPSGDDEEDRETSGASARTWDEEEDPATGLKSYKTDVKED